MTAGGIGGKGRSFWDGGAKDRRDGELFLIIYGGEKGRVE